MRYHLSDIPIFDTMRDVSIFKNQRFPQWHSRKSILKNSRYKSIYNNGFRNHIISGEGKFSNPLYIISDKKFMYTIDEYSDHYCMPDMMESSMNYDIRSNYINDDAWLQEEYYIERERKMTNRYISSKAKSSMFSIASLLELEVARIAIDSIKHRYGEEIMFYGDSTNDVNKWIKKYDNKFENRLKSSNNSIINEQFVISLDKNTFAYIRSGQKIDKVDSIIGVNKNYGQRNDCDISIYIFGKHYKKYVAELREFIKTTKSGSLYKYNVSGYRDKERMTNNMNSIVSELDKRDIDTLFYEEGIKESICDHIDNFLNNKSIYESRNLNHKTGILLYGEPGTGKTSLSTALANKYKHSLIVIDMNTFDSLNIESLKSCVDTDQDNFIILLEDIDTIYTSLDREENIDRDTKKVVNKMLQFLDSSSSPKDVIFIATTNNINVLDSAITRDGRFDLKVEVGGINKKIAKEMIMSFGIKSNDADDLIKDLPAKINQSSLQNIILNYFKDNMHKEVVSNE